MLLNSQCVPTNRILLSLRWSPSVSSRTCAGIVALCLPQNDLAHVMRTSLTASLSSSSVFIPFPQQFYNTLEALLNPADLWLSLLILLAEFALGKIPLRLHFLFA